MSICGPKTNQFTKVYRKAWLKLLRLESHTTLSSSRNSNNQNLQWPHPQTTTCALHTSKIWKTDPKSRRLGDTKASQMKAFLHYSRWTVIKVRLTSPTTRGAETHISIILRRYQTRLKERWTNCSRAGKSTTTLMSRSRSNRQPRQMPGASIKTMRATH